MKLEPDWVQITAPPLVTCVNSGKMLIFFRYLVSLKFTICEMVNPLEPVYYLVTVWSCPFLLIVRAQSPGQILLFNSVSEYSSDVY